MSIVDHHSYSSIQCYEKCPWQWYQSYVLKIRKPESDTLKIGKALHHMLEMNARKYVAEGKRMTVEEAIKVFKSVWPKSHEGLVRAYYRKDDWINPLSEEFIEYPFLIELGNGVKLKGAIDIISDQKIIFDYKTAKNPYATHYIKDSLQHSLYALVYYDRFKELPKGVGYQVIIKDFSGVQKLLDTRTLVQIEKAREYVLQCDAEMNNAVVFQKKRGKLCYYCDYQEECTRCD